MGMGMLGKRYPLMQSLSSSGQAPWVVEGNRPPAGWPPRGEVEFRNYSVRYRPGLELVLKNLSLQVHGGEKVRGVGFVPGEHEPVSTQPGRRSARPPRGVLKTTSPADHPPASPLMAPPPPPGGHRGPHWGWQIVHDSLPVPHPGSCGG